MTMHKLLAPTCKATCSCGYLQQILAMWNKETCGRNDDKNAATCRRHNEACSRCCGSGTLTCCPRETMCSIWVATLH